MAASIDGYSTPEELTAFLQGLQAQADEANVTLRVVGRGVCFKDAANREMHYGNDININRRYALASTVVSNAVQTGMRMMVANAPHVVRERSWVYREGNWTEQRENDHREGKADWHCFAIYIVQGVFYIYDPSYLPRDLDAAGSSNQRRRIGALPNLNMARNIVQLWKARPRPLRGIWVGGGGNETNVCRNMTAEWMEDLVARLAQGESVDVEGWEEIRL